MHMEDRNWIVSGSGPSTGPAVTVIWENELLYRTPFPTTPSLLISPQNKFEKQSKNKNIYGIFSDLDFLGTYLSHSVSPATEAVLDIIKLGLYSHLWKLKNPIFEKKTYITINGDCHWESNWFYLFFIRVLWRCVNVLPS